MRISDWSSDVCSSVLALQTRQANFGAILDPSIGGFQPNRPAQHFFVSQQAHRQIFARHQRDIMGMKMKGRRSEEHTSELQSLMRISYAVFCLKKNTNITEHNAHITRLFVHDKCTRDDKTDDNNTK